MKVGRALVVCAALLLTGCAGESRVPSGGPSAGAQPSGSVASDTRTDQPTAPPTAGGSPSPGGSHPSAPVTTPGAGTPTPVAPTPVPSPSDGTGTPTPVPPTPAPAFDRRAALAVVADLAGGIGPREATSDAFREAARLVSGQLADLGYDVTSQRVPVPAGTSWGVPVRAGSSQNVVATPAGFRADRPHRLIGAHLDTVPQAPGAEDNASGIGVMLELARIASLHPPDVPVVFVAFGAEEPRGPGDALHHFGSRRMVAQMPGSQRDSLVGMLSLDRVGVRGPHVPACFGGLGSSAIREQLVAAARTLDVPVRRCVNRTSDHWSFEKAGIPAARLGSIPYAGYHSSADVPSVVDAGQLGRVGRIAREWMLAARLS